MSAFDHSLPAKVGHERDHSYAHGVDPAITYDSTWSIVLDITDPERWVGVSAAFKSGRQTAESILALTGTTSRRICSRRTLRDGDRRHRFRRQGVPFALAEHESAGHSRGVRRQGLREAEDAGKPQAAIDSGRLYLPQSGPWLILYRQLLAYKLNDRKLDTDAVMALMLAVRMAGRTIYGDNRALPFDYLG